MEQPMSYFDNATVIQAGNSVIVTRPTIMGKVATHVIHADYNAEEIAAYLRGEVDDLIQNVFPKMSAEDREFLMTGITPQEWRRMFND
jgi:hypothetical protein